MVVAAQPETIEPSRSTEAMVVFITRALHFEMEISIVATPVHATTDAERRRTASHQVVPIINSRAAARDPQPDFSIGEEIVIDETIRSETRIDAGTGSGSRCRDVSH